MNIRPGNPGLYISPLYTLLCLSGCRTRISFCPGLTSSPISSFSSRFHPLSCRISSRFPQSISRLYTISHDSGDTPHFLRVIINQLRVLKERAAAAGEYQKFQRQGRLYFRLTDAKQHDIHGFQPPFQSADTAGVQSLRLDQVVERDRFLQRPQRLLSSADTYSIFTRRTPSTTMPSSAACVSSIRIRPLPRQT